MLKIYQIINLFVLAPLFFPVFSYCPFRLPYLYCFVCPVRCIWYRIRGLVFIIAIGLNIKRDLFCTHVCPFGTIQALLSKVCPKKVSLPRSFRIFKYIAMAIIISVIVVTGWPQLLSYRFLGLSLSQLFILKMKNLLSFIFFAGMIASIISYRFFCYNLCPVRTLSEFLHKLKLK